MTRQCTCGQHAPGGRCDACARNASGHDLPSNAVHRIVGTPGAALDARTQSEMERHLGSRFPAAAPQRMPSGDLRLGQRGDAEEHEAEHASHTAPERTENAFGARGLNLSTVRLHTDVAAADSARALGALAYAVGPHIVFGSGQYAPSTSVGRTLLMHELAHVLQPSNSDGIGVVRRYTAFSADDQLHGHSRGWKHPAGSPLRVADDGQIVVEDMGWGPGLTKRAWTTPGHVALSNRTLADQGSRAKLQLKGGGQEISGKAPDSNMPSKLEEIEPVRYDGNPVDLASDCGSACRQVMGSGPAGKKDVAVIKGQEPSGAIGGAIGAVSGLVAGGALGAGLGSLVSGTAAAVAGVAGAIGGLVGGMFAGSAIEKKLRGKPKEEYLTPRSYHGGNPTTPEEWSQEIFAKEFGSGLTREQLYQKYAELSPAAKDAFDRKYGINKYAVPRVGQGITISTEKDMPGFTTTSGFTWNFHYAAAVLSSGHDYVTLESAAGWSPTDWIFFMYGPETKGQSFYEEQGATQTHGSKFSSFVVQPEP